MSGGYKVPPGDDDRLAKSLAEIRRRLDELERPTGTQLADTVSKLADTLANQVVPQIKTTVTSSFLITTSSAVFASLAMNVPDGYTRALIFASATASETPVSTIDRIRATITIGADVGPEVFGYTDQSVGGSVSISYGSIQTGLVGGGTVGISLALRNLIGNSGTGTASRAVLTAFAIYLK